MIKTTDDEFCQIVNYIKINYGINLSQKRILLEGRLNNYLQEKGYSNYTDYFTALKADKTGQETTNLLNRVTTNHTYFMREADHFDFLTNHVLPDIEKSINDFDLRTWCAAASSGEEPYTLAMILNDYFTGKASAWDKKLLATDISIKVLKQAKAGIYPADSIAVMPEPWKTRYFVKADSNSVMVSPQIKGEVVYRHFNLMNQIIVKKPYHIIFCRNVMIYFDAATKAALLERMYNVLVPGGYLFLGHTESMVKSDRFKCVYPSVYKKLF